MKPLRAVVSAAALLTIAVTVGAETQAFYGNGAQIVSAHFGRLEQADDQSDYAAISADGNYVVIQTRARNLFADDDPDPPGQYRQGGLFRFNLATNAIELVADGNLHDEGTNQIVERGAQNPSVSSGGRYVAFSTAQQLAAADANGNVDVYVRDMQQPLRSPAAYELVSAKDGGSEPATYASRPSPLPGLDPGAEVTRGSAISLDGRKVVFRTLAQSDLPAAGDTTTPEFQIFVRDLDQRSTTLVTRTSATGEPAGGALGPVGISGDGTAVAWNGRNAFVQTRFLLGEQRNDDFFYYLWQRVADGPAAPTRRITGVADPDDPNCPPNGAISPDPTATGPCYGPLTDNEQTPADISSQLPAMSSDGFRVAFLTGAGPRPNNLTGSGLDLYLTDMRPGVSRKAGTIELTRDGVPGTADSAPLDGLSMSPSGRYLSTTSSRLNFVLPALRPLRAARPVADARELYVIDLAERTIERVLRSTSGSDIDSSVANGATIAEGGGRIAFVSGANNLFFGDGNSRSDAFVVTRQDEPVPTPTPPLVRPGGGDGGVIVEEDPVGPELIVRSRRLRGRIELRVTVPAPGTVKATARARIKGLKGRRVVARATRFTPRAGRVTLVLKVVRRYRGRLRGRGRIVARTRVTFIPSRGGRRMGDVLRLVFR